MIVSTAIVAANPAPLHLAGINISVALRQRREYVSGELVRFCQHARKPRVLSFGNGELREAEAALALITENGGEFVAVDSDAVAVEQLRRTHSSSRVRCIARTAIPDDGDLGHFDFIYALNLLNELNDTAALRALRRLCRLLHPAGTLLVSNFTPEAREQLCGKNLAVAYRDELKLARLGSAVSSPAISAQMVWRDDSDAIAFLELQRSSDPEGANGRPQGVRASISS